VSISDAIRARGFGGGWYFRGRDAFQEDVAASEEADEDAVDDLGLANDDFADLLADSGELRGGELKSSLWLHLDILSQWVCGPFLEDLNPAITGRGCDGEALF
jgi:hypothetical protein